MKRRTLLAGVMASLLPLPSYAAGEIPVTYWTTPGALPWQQDWPWLMTRLEPFIELYPVLRSLLLRAQAGEGMVTDVLDGQRFTAMTAGRRILVPNIEAAFGPGWAGKSTKMRMIQGRQRKDGLTVIVTVWVHEVCGNVSFSLTYLHQPNCIPCPLPTEGWSEMRAAQSPLLATEVAARAARPWG